MAECSPPPSRLPSLAGTDAERLDDYLPPLPSRSRVYQQVAEALNEMEHSLDPVILMLVAEWGDGKTSVYNTRIKPWATARGWVVLEARAATVMEHLRSLEDAAEKSPAYRLLAAVLAAGLEHAGQLSRFGPPSRAGSVRGYVLEVLRGVSGGRRLLVFLDEMEDIVASYSEERLAELVAGLVGLVNGEVEAVSAACRAAGGGGYCSPGSLHLVVSLTPPAYSRLMGLKDFATVASRLRRRIRTVWIRSLPRREALVFLESLARYSMGSGLPALFETPALANAVVSGTLGNMGALVSAFRYLVSWATGRGGCRGVKRLAASELVEALQTLTLSVGGAELPALNPEAYTRLREGWEARAKLAGFEPAAASRLLDELIARGLIVEEEAQEALGIGREQLLEMVEELNLYGENSWPRRELGVAKLVYRVRAVAAVEDAFKLLRSLEPEAVKLLPQLAPREGFKPLEALLDSLVYMDSDGRLVVAVPEDREEAAGLVRDSSPLELGGGEAERLAGLLWDNLFSKLAPVDAPRALLLSPKIQRVLYVSPELHYLDFIADRVERLQLLRRAYSEASRSHLLVGLTALLSYAGLAEQPSLAGDGVARLEARLNGPARARVLLYTVPGEVTGEEAERLEKRVLGVVMSGWRPHAVLLAYYGSIEARAEDKLSALERSLFIKVVRLPIPSMVSRVQLLVLGAKLAAEASGVEEALGLAARIADVQLQRSLGFDPFRLQALLHELLSEMRPLEKLEAALREGVDGVPLIIVDPKLGYDVEKPTELSGALRYFLVVPSTKTRPSEALSAAYEYIMRYHIHRHGGEAGRGILSPDIDRGEVSTLEKYMVLLAANGMLEKLDGSVRIDVLSPMERAVLKALEQAGARSEEGVPASAAWANLVVAARNPGTRRMLLQALAYRGLVEVQGSGRRLDPDRSRVRLVDGRDAWRLLEKARELVERLESTPEAMEWGYIVSAKARGYRAGSLAELASKMRSLLSLAEEALRAGERLTALRLARTAIDTLDYVVSEVVEKHVRAAVADAERLRRELLGRAERIRELRESLEKLLESLTGKRVRVEVELLERLGEAEKAFQEVAGLRLTEKQLDEEVRRLWEEARRKSPRDPGRRLPFYVQGTGPLYHFNYKYWLLVSRLEKLGLVEAVGGAVRVGGELARVEHILERLVEEARRALEEAAEARREAERLATTLTKLGVHGVKPETLMLQGLNVPERVSLAEAEQLVEALRARVEEARRPVEELVRLAERLAAKLGEAGRLEREALQLAARARREASLAARAAPDIASRLLEAAKDLELAARQAEAVAGKAVELLSSTPRLAEALADAEKMAESARLLVGDTVSRAERLLEEAEREAARRLEALEAEAEALASALRKAGAQAPPRPEYTTPLEGLAALASHVEELRRLVLEAGVLDGEELEAYRALMLARRRHGELTLTQAARIIAGELGVAIDRAKRLIIRLIEREVIEPRI